MDHRNWALLFLLNDLSQELHVPGDGSTIVALCKALISIHA